MSVHDYLFHHIASLTRSQKRAIFLAVDMALASVAFTGLGLLGRDLYRQDGLVYLAIVSFVSAMASLSFGLPRIKLNAYGRHALVATVKFSVSVTGAILFLCPVFHAPIDAFDAMEFSVALFLGSVASRYGMLAVLLWVLRQGQVRRRVLIYGAGDTGAQMALALRHHQRILPVAFLDDDTDLQNVTVAGLKVLSPACLETSMHRLAVGRVLLAMPSASAAKLAQITRRLHALGLEVQAVPSFAQLVGTDAVSTALPQRASAQFLGRTTYGEDMSGLGNFYKGRVVLVSGAGGSVGSELCRQLLAHQPKSLVLFERSERALYTAERELRDLTQRMNIEIVPVLGSVTDMRLARSTMLDHAVDVVFHAAAYKHVPLVEANPVAGLANNVIGTRIFADAAIAAGVSRFVLISTDKAVRPTSVMGATKRLAELVVQDLAKRHATPKFSTVRFGNVLGSSGSVLPLFRDQIESGGPITLTHANVTRYFMTLAEAARLVLLTGSFSQPEDTGDVFVLDMGMPVRIRDLAEQMIKAEGLSVRSDLDPTGDIEIKVTGLRKGEKLHEEQLIQGKMWSTPHPKVVRVQVASLSECAMASALNAARAAIDAGNQQAARAVITLWVDGFPQAYDSPPKTNDIPPMADLKLFADWEDAGVPR